MHDPPVDNMCPHICPYIYPYAYTPMAIPLCPLLLPARATRITGVMLATYAMVLPCYAHIPLPLGAHLAEW